MEVQLLSILGNYHRARLTDQPTNEGKLHLQKYAKLAE